MYRKNTAGQFITVQLLLTATGAVATGLTPAARRCIDGTFAAGTGTFTEDGSTGSYKYALSQADTNGNNIQIITTATGAMPVVINFVTTAADPTDGVRLGLTALPNAAAGANGGLPTGDASGRVGIQAGTSAGQLDFTSGVVKANATQWLGGTIPAVNVTGVPLVDLKYTLGTISPATAGSVRADSVTGAVGSVTAGVTVTTNNDKTGYTASTVSDKTGYALTAAYDLAKTAAQAGDAMALTSGERNSTADAFLNRDMSTGTDSGSPSVRTVRQALRFLRNKWSVSAGTLTITKEDDTTASWTSTMATDAAAVPIIGSDPA